MVSDSVMLFSCLNFLALNEVGWHCAYVKLGDHPSSDFCWEFIGYPVVPVVTAGFLQGTVYRGLTEEDEQVAIKVLFMFEVAVMEHFKF